MLSVIFVSMLMILLSIINVIRHLICDNKYNWLLNLNLIYEILWTRAESGLLISVLQKLMWFHLTSLWKWMGLFLSQNNLLRCWDWPLLTWIGALTLSLLRKLPPRNCLWEPWFILSSFFPLRLLCISVNLPSAHPWNTVVTFGQVPLLATWNC